MPLFRVLLVVSAFVTSCFHRIRRILLKQHTSKPVWRLLYFGLSPIFQNHKEALSEYLIYRLLLCVLQLVISNLPYLHDAAAEFIIELISFSVAPFLLMLFPSYSNSHISSIYTSQILMCLTLRGLYSNGFLFISINV